MLSTDEGQPVARGRAPADGRSATRRAAARPSRGRARSAATWTSRRVGRGGEQARRPRSARPARTGPTSSASTHSPAQIRSGDPAHPLVARGHLRRPGQHQGHGQEGQRPTQLDPLAALLRGAPRWSGRGARPPRCDQTPEGLSVCSGEESRAREFLSVCPREACPGRRATPGRAAFLTGLPDRPG